MLYTQTHGRSQAQALQTEITTSSSFVKFQEASKGIKVFAEWARMIYQ